MIIKKFLIQFSLLIHLPAYNNVTYDGLSNMVKHVIEKCAYCQTIMFL